MVNMKHISSSLRLVNVEDDASRGLRTFSGVRGNLTTANVTNFMRGYNGLTRVPAHNAVLTTRAAFEHGN